jgi:acyl carrier protein
MSDLHDVVAQRLSDAMGIDTSLITPNVTFVELKLDSLALVEFSVILEEEYGVAATELRPDATFGEAVALVEAGLAAADRDGR